MSNFCWPSQVRKPLEIWASSSDESGRFRPWGKWSSNSRHFQACSRHQVQKLKHKQEKCRGFQWLSWCQTTSNLPPPIKVSWNVSIANPYLSLSFASTINSPSLGNGDTVISDFFFGPCSSHGTCSMLTMYVPPFMPFIREAGPKRSPQWTSTKCLGHGGK